MFNKSKFISHTLAEFSKKYPNINLTSTSPNEEQLEYLSKCISSALLSLTGLNLNLQFVHRDIAELYYKSVVLNIYNIYSGNDSVKYKVCDLASQLAFSSVLLDSIQPVENAYPGLFDKFKFHFPDVSIQLFLLTDKNSKELEMLNFILGLDPAFVNFCYRFIADSNLLNLVGFKLIAYNSRQYLVFRYYYVEVGVPSVIEDSSLIANLETKVALLSTSL